MPSITSYDEEQSQAQNVWEQAAKHYESTYETQYRRADTLEKKLILRLLGQFPDAKSLLEVGCGTAHFTKWLQAKGYQCYGLDSSGGMLREAKKQWSNSTLIKADGSHLPLKSKSVDIVVFITSLEFIPQVTEALSESAHVARRGIILGLLNKNSLTTLKRLLNPKKSPPYSIAHFYSVSDIRKTLSAAIQERYEIAFYSSTVFPRLLGNLESGIFPFGGFLGISVKLE